MNTSFKFTLVAITAALSLSACSDKKELEIPEGDAKQTTNQSAKQSSSLNQADVCEVSTWQFDVSARVCKPGQKVIFLPQKGNEQLPILFAAVNCDMRYSIALTNGGVACIYSPIKPREQAQQAQQSSAPAAQPAPAQQAPAQQAPAQQAPAQPQVQMK